MTADDLSVLYLDGIEVFESREDYLKKVGKRAPVFDAARPIQMWRDQRRESATYQAYVAVNPSAQGEDSLWVYYQVPSNEMREPNIPGADKYPSFTPDPSPAQVAVDPLGERWDTVDSRRLIPFEQAKEIAAEINGGAPIQMTVGYSVRWNGETRRFYGSMFKGDFVDLASLRNIKYSLGVGAPGKWDLSTSTPTWVPSMVPPQPLPNHPVRHIPCRQLRDGEKIKKLSPTGPWRVITGDEPGTGANGSFTVADRELMRAIASDVREVMSLLKGGSR